MTLRRHVSALMIIGLATFVAPLFTHAADANLEAQLRTMLSESAAQEGISSTELDTLVKELSEKASAEGITAETVSTAASVPVTAAPPVQSGLPTVNDTSSAFALNSGYLTLFTIVGLLLLGMVLVALWRKLEHKEAPQPAQQPVQPPFQGQ